MGTGVVGPDGIGRSLLGALFRERWGRLGGASCFSAAVPTPVPTAAAANVPSTQSEQLWCQGQGAFLERCDFLHLLSYQSHDHLRSLFTFCACPCSPWRYSALWTTMPRGADDQWHRLAKSTESLGTKVRTQ